MQLNKKKNTLSWICTVLSILVVHVINSLRSCIFVKLCNVYILLLKDAD